MQRPEFALRVPPFRRHARKAVDFGLIDGGAGGVFHSVLLLRSHSVDIETTPRSSSPAVTMTSIVPVPVFPDHVAKTHAGAGTFARFRKVHTALVTVVASAILSHGCSMDFPASLLQLSPIGPYPVSGLTSQVMVRQRRKHRQNPSQRRQSSFLLNACSDPPAVRLRQVAYASPSLRSTGICLRGRAPGDRHLSDIRKVTFMARIVMKFGGTSVANIERIRNVARHVKREVDQGTRLPLLFRRCRARPTSWSAGRARPPSCMTRANMMPSSRPANRSRPDFSPSPCRTWHQRPLMAGLADSDQDGQCPWRGPHPRH